MNAEGLVVVDRAEQIKWWDALDALFLSAEEDASVDVEEWLQMARACLHPDAQWVASLLPPGEPATLERVREVLEAQGDDPRALLLRWKVSEEPKDRGLLRRAAETGYAPAEAAFSERATGYEGFSWAQREAEKRDRVGLFQLGLRLRTGTSCERDMKRALELYRQSAELGYPRAQLLYGLLAFGDLQWERFYWCGLAATRGIDAHTYGATVCQLLPSFVKGEHCRIMHIW
jgi:hypothetical protein